MAHFRCLSGISPSLPSSPGLGPLLPRLGWRRSRRLQGPRGEAGESAEERRADRLAGALPAVGLVGRDLSERSLLLRPQPRSEHRRSEADRCGAREGSLLLFLAACQTCALSSPSPSPRRPSSTTGSCAVRRPRCPRIRTSPTSTSGRARSPPTSSFTWQALSEFFSEYKGKNYFYQHEEGRPGAAVLNWKNPNVKQQIFVSRTEQTRPCRRDSKSGSTEASTVSI